MMVKQTIKKVFRSRISVLLLGFTFVVFLTCIMAKSCISSVGSCVCTCKGEMKAYRRISKKECEAKTNVENDCKCVYEFE